MVKLNFNPADVAPEPDYDNLPDIPAMRELKSMRQWVCWRYAARTTKDGKTTFTKPPMCPHHTLGASITTPSHWGSYDQAVKRTKDENYAGIGFVLTENDDITGADLDHCRNPETGELQPWAHEIVALGETYVEVSPSGEGLRIL